MKNTNDSGRKAGSKDPTVVRQAPASARGMAEKNRHLRTLSSILGAAAVVGALGIGGLTGASLKAAMPPAGSVIGNQASATYTDASNTSRFVTSNATLTVVQQVAGLDLIDPMSKIVSPGGQVTFPHTVTNTGNGIDHFLLSAVDRNVGNINLTGITIYADANGDGIPDNNMPITQTPLLAAGQAFSFLVVATVPGITPNGATEQLRITATSHYNGSVTEFNDDTITVSSNAVIAMNKAVNKPTAVTDEIVTYTLIYQNTGNTTATDLVITDTIEGGKTYVPGSARWSVTGATALTDGDDGTQGSGVNLIDFTVVGNVITARISQVVASQAGSLTFSVKVEAGPARTEINVASFDYHNGDAPVLNQLTNIASFQVLPAYSVTFTGPEPVTSAPQGATVSFNNTLTNTGTATDTFEITINNTSSTFPNGTTFSLFQADGLTPLLDSNGNGTPDTGPLAAGGVYVVVLRATLPNSAPAIPPPSSYVVTKTARSMGDPAQTATAIDTLLLINVHTVDLQNAGGLGAGPFDPAALNPTTTNTVAPGVVTRFELVVVNTSSIADTYNLQASYSTSFNPVVALPAGWSVTFRNQANAAVSSTGTINAGASRTLYADVTVPAGAAPGNYELYFRALSPTTGALDIKWDRVAVNQARQLHLMPDNAGQVFPGGSIVYSHLLANLGNVVEGGAASTIMITTSHSIDGWTSVVYRDSNGNGMLDATDEAIDPSGNGIPSLLAVNGGSQLLFVKVFAPPSAPSGMVDVVTVTATTSNGTNSGAVPAVVFNTDTTTIISGDLIMVKEQAVTANAVAPSGYSTAQATALPGQYIHYRITITNSGNTDADAIIVNDSTPTYTKYWNAIPAAVTGGSVAAPSNLAAAHGTATMLTFNIGTLSSGSAAVVTFMVKVDE
jgi:trimeric autotransporter adhesin